MRCVWDVRVVRPGSLVSPSRDTVAAVAQSGAPLSEITRVLSIHTLPASTVLDHVNQYADADGKLRQASFIRAFQAFLVRGVLACACVGCVHVSTRGVCMFCVCVHVCACVLGVGGGCMCLHGMWGVGAVWAMGEVPAACHASRGPCPCVCAQVENTPAMRERAAVLLSHLFSLFDADGNGDVDSAEMLAGLSVLCGGSQDDKVETAFRVYDLNHDGFVSEDEMVAYLTAVFRVRPKGWGEGGGCG